MHNLLTFKALSPFAQFNCSLGIAPLILHSSCPSITLPRANERILYEHIAYEVNQQEYSIRVINITHE